MHNDGDVAVLHQAIDLFDLHLHVFAAYNSDVICFFMMISQKTSLALC